jgi:hypothetical protein
MRCGGRKSRGGIYAAGRPWCRSRARSAVLPALINDWLNKAEGNSGKGVGMTKLKTQERENRELREVSEILHKLAHIPSMRSSAIRSSDDHLHW